MPTGFVGQALDALHALVMLLMAAVAEVEAGDVHARLDHLAQDVLVIAGGAHGANDLGAFVHPFLQALKLLLPSSVKCIIRRAQLLSLLGLEETCQYAKPLPFVNL